MVARNIDVQPEKWILMHHFCITNIFFCFMVTNQLQVCYFPTEICYMASVGLLLFFACFLFLLLFFVLLCFLLLLFSF